MWFESKSIPCRNGYKSLKYKPFDFILNNPNLLNYTLKLGLFEFEWLIEPKNVFKFEFKLLQEIISIIQTFEFQASHLKFKMEVYVGVPKLLNPIDYVIESYLQLETFFRPAMVIYLFVVCR